MKECLTSHIPTLKNYADLLTKVLSDKKQRDLVGGVLHYIYDKFQYNCPSFEQAYTKVGATLRGLKRYAQLWTLQGPGG